MTGKSVSILIVSLILVCLMTHGEVNALEKPASFSGDLVITESDGTTRAKIYVRDPYIRRVEMSKEAGGMIYIRPPDARGKIWVLDPAAKQYTILSAGFPARKDPVEAWRDLQNDMGGGPKGEEVLNGYPCKIFHFSYRDQEKIVVRVWQADDLRYAIKIEADAELAIGLDADSELVYRPMKGTFEILNIEMEELDDALFEIPADYVEVKQASK